MLKKSLLFAGVAGASLLAAAEPAPNTGAAAPQVCGEETVTVVAVPGQCAPVPGQCASAPAPQGGAGQCATQGSCATNPTGDYSADDYELAYCLMEAGGVPAGIDDANTFIILEEMDQMPMLKPAQPAFEHFLRKHCSYQAMKRDLARLHLQTFTRDEMRQLIDFFKTPAGRKFAASQSGLSRSALALRADRIHRNLPELRKNVQECLVQAQQSGAPATASK